MALLTENAAPHPLRTHWRRLEMTNWTLAARAAKMNPSVIREILKVT